MNTTMFKLKKKKKVFTYKKEHFLDFKKKMAEREYKSSTPSLLF